MHRTSLSVTWDGIGAVVLAMTSVMAARLSSIVTLRGEVVWGRDMGLDSSFHLN